MSTPTDGPGSQGQAAREPGPERQDQTSPEAGAGASGQVDPSEADSHTRPVPLDPHGSSDEEAAPMPREG